MELKIGEQMYRSGKLDAFQQLHVARRLAPFLGRLAGTDGRDAERDVLAIIGDIAGAVATVSDEDVEYILNVCLEVTERRQPGGSWAPLRRNGVTMFGDVSLPAMLSIASEVIRENLADFFSDPALAGLREKANALMSRG